jgi:hypothetical protein
LDVDTVEPPFLISGEAKTLKQLIAAQHYMDLAAPLPLRGSMQLLVVKDNAQRLSLISAMRASGDAQARRGLAPPLAGWIGQTPDDCDTLGDEWPGAPSTDRTAKLDISH